MQSRRSFFTKLSLAIAPLIFIPKFEPIVWKVITPPGFTPDCGSITQASIAQLTPAQLEMLFRPSGLFDDMDAFFHASFDMRALEGKTRGMYDWVMESNNRLIPKIERPIIELGERIGDMVDHSLLERAI